MQDRLLDLPQGSPEWLAWRQGGVGGSDIASILGISPYPDSTREDLLREKVTGVGKTPSAAMRRGQQLESVARTRYRNGLKGAVIRVCCAAHPDYLWARASLDGLCHHIGRLTDHWLIEIKAPRDEVHQTALNGQVPHFSLVQIQWQLFVTGLRWCDYISFNDGLPFAEGDHLAVVPIRRDDALIATLVSAASEFWAEVLQARQNTRERGV